MVEYVWDSPLNRSDPSGLQSRPPTYGPSPGPSNLLSNAIAVPPASPPTSQPPIIAPACIVRLRCIYLLGVAALHCGVEVSWANRTEYYHIMDNSADLIPQKCNYSYGGRIFPLIEDYIPGGWFTAARWVLADATKCGCFRRQASALDAANLDYKVIPNGRCSTKCNCNYAAKCMLGFCGLKMVWSSGAKPVGWDHRAAQCQIKGRCHKRKLVDTAFCREATNGMLPSWTLSGT